MSRLALVPVNVQSLTAAPTTPTLRAGDLYFNSSTSALNVYSGTAWIALSGSTAAGDDPITTALLFGGM